MTFNWDIVMDVDNENKAWFGWHSFRVLIPKNETDIIDKSPKKIFLLLLGVSGHKVPAELMWFFRFWIFTRRNA